LRTQNIDGYDKKRRAEMAPILEEVGATSTDDLSERII
jgi:hypothetical protein